jgi:hypothetical protein
LAAQPFAYLKSMTDKDQHKDSRKRRLSAALRDNLKRRKAQARERADEVGCSAKSHDSAGIDGDKQQNKP